MNAPLSKTGRRRRSDAADFSLARALWRLGHNMEDVAQMMGRNMSSINRGWHDEGYTRLASGEPRRANHLRYPRAPLGFADYVYVIGQRRAIAYRELLTTILRYEWDGTPPGPPKVGRPRTFPPTSWQTARPAKPAAPVERVYPPRPRGQPSRLFRLGAHDDAFTMFA